MDNTELSQLPPKPQEELTAEEDQAVRALTIVENAQGPDHLVEGVSARMLGVFKAKTSEEAQAKILYGKELGWGPMTSIRLLNSFWVWDAKLRREVLQIAPSANALSGLMRKRGGSFWTVRDFQLVMETDNPKDYYINGNPVLREDGKPNYFGQQARKATTPEGKAAEAFQELMSKCTTLEAYRPGETRPHYVNISMKEVFDMGIATNRDGTWKDAWYKQPRTMLYWRCISKMSRTVFSDFTEGLYLADELAPDAGFIHDAAGNTHVEK